ncbi:MAG: NAD(P)/FAD-dependent oxidoreductase [Gordonia sp. (in: high G+C Gram-positive bacteria)]|uniref:FAD-dependent oxidoreductase n=1 Tax=Gordonia sp. (in: high G+C Gram-positive bacteria) TaxID=84139 RepID=UPI0039E514A2
MKVLVIGAGIAGCAAAVALRKAGHDPVVFESHDQTADGVGAWLTLAANGIDALAAIDIDEPALGGGFPTPRFELFAHDGRSLATFLTGPTDTYRTTTTIRRADLYRILRDAVAARGITIHYGRALTGVETTSSGGVRAAFEDGSIADGDLLVGADGLHSAVRRIIDPQCPPPRYTGLLNTGGFASGAGLRLDGTMEQGTMEFRFGRRCFLGQTLAPNGDVWWFANPFSDRELGADELRALDGPRWREDLADLFTGDDIPARALIDATDHVYAGWNTYDLPRVPIWHRDRVVIIGDAAHAISPTSGQGASLAIEDAVQLARALRDLPYEKALPAYEAMRRNRVERAVAEGARTGSSKSAGPFGRFVRNRVVMPIIARKARRQDPTADWLTGSRIDWDQPVS